MFVRRGVRFSMNPYQAVFLTIAVSIPVVTLAGIGRAALCAYRSQRAGKASFTLMSAAAILVLLAVFSIDVIAWFAYGVGHMEKNAKTDLILLSSTVVPTYLAAFGIWRLAIAFERRLDS